MATEPKKAEGTVEGKTPEPKTGAAKKPAAEKPAKKENIFKRAGNWFKKKENKKLVITGLAGIATGVGATVGVSEIGKRAAEKKARRNDYIPQQEYSPIDPNN